ncbi:putative Na+/H+ antiporter CNH1 [Emericellopsis atlantica]|uniref:Na+/H+ antiporter CNH1 n=1 Tax=Emericellopsis atlantica TaxID=2614577 RepID=A0A9P8CKV2_9HYPO|nr:putative Na+/H+ antiporter CNH1 [Emericellopsis atlantica]KAG9250738.1 putative Na+/H+ antiporter CNH1 [Emericellopsis atlantica]
MAWHHLDITDSHLVYAILGGFTTLFMLCSSFIKERMYIGEATVATLAGVIFGPHCANLIDPNSWGSTDIVTIEFSRIVLVVQCFAIGVELPKYYMEKHWRSVVYLLVPVMTFGWLITSLFIWWMIVPFNWLDSLVVAACVTATDPVLASSVVGKGKFAKRVPKHLRDLLSAESGCNDGMAFPFVYLSLYLIQYNRSASDVSFHFVVYVILYECVFGTVYGFLIGYIARHGIRYAERHDMIDRESFLVFYFVVALFCAGTGSILGLDDLLVGFAAGVGFSNDGWFLEKTEESHVSNVIDLLLNLTYFVYLGTIIPWEQYNSGVEGLYVWRLVVIAIFVIFFRRIPAMLALKPLIPDIRTWREALFAGHFGPIGVGAIFVAILARAELEHEEPVPLAVLPDSSAPEFKLIYLVWPIVTFIVISSIIVHGSSIAVFTLGKRINTLSLTMSYTAAPDDGPSWMNRLPRISSTSRSQAKMSEGSMEKEPEFPADTLAPPGGFLRRRKEDDDSRRGSRASSLASRRRKSRKSDAGGPISQSAIYPSREGSGMMSPTSPEGALSPDVETPTGDNDLNAVAAIDSLKEKGARMPEEGHEASRHTQRPRQIEVYEEGREMVFEDQDGEVLDVQPSGRGEGQERDDNELPAPVTQTPSRPWTLGNIKRNISTFYTTEMEKRKSKEASSRRHEPARAYQFGNTIIVEDEDGEVVKTYQIPAEKAEGQSDRLNASLKYVGLGGLASRQQPASTAAGADAGESSTAAQSRPAARGWTSFLGTGKTPAAEEQGNPVDDDKKIRFTIGGEGRRMTKEDFIAEIQKLDASTRKQVVEDSNAPRKLKTIARQDPALVPPIVEHRPSDEEHAQGSSSSSTANKATPSDDNVETAAERRRRLAVLATQGDDEDDDDYGETPAERRRRQAALGTTEDDSDEEGASAAQNTRIRFAEPERGRR